MLKFDLDCPKQVWLNDGSGWAIDEGRVTVKKGETVIAAGSPVSTVRLVYETSFETEAKFLGDAWERGYGELEWRGMRPERAMPWYMAVDENGKQSFVGALTGAHAFVSFRAAAKSVIVEIDVRSGSGPVRLEKRSLSACTLYAAFNAEERAYDFLRKVLKCLCPGGAKKAKEPVYGGNNWYYAYGVSSRDEILADAAFVSRLAGGQANRPYMVIDDGWQKHSRKGFCAGGPWVGNPAYGNIGKLAKDMKDAGVKPGVWIRPLLMAEKPADDWILFEEDGNWMLDPSNPEVLAHVASIVRDLAGQGFELIKHDYSTYDIFGKWGFQLLDQNMAGAHLMADDTRTNAEIVLALYQAIAAAAGETVIIGCNTIGHLAAGLFELQRTGDDTSGRNWERTRRMGVNTLAMRMVQHGVFFDCDADCAAITPDVDWNLARRWLDVLSRSGTPLFVSARPGTLTADQEQAVAEAFARAAVNTCPAEPLDWQHTSTPRLWKCDGGIREYDFDDLFRNDAPDVWWY